MPLDRFIKLYTFSGDGFVKIEPRAQQSSYAPILANFPLFFQIHLDLSHLTLCVNHSDSLAVRRISLFQNITVRMHNITCRMANITERFRKEARLNSRLSVQFIQKANAFSFLYQYSFAKSFAKASIARARWLIAFFSSAFISAKVLPIGSYRNKGS